MGKKSHREIWAQTFDVLRSPSPHWNSVSEDPGCRKSEPTGRSSLRTKRVSVLSLFSLLTNSFCAWGPVCVFAGLSLPIHSKVHSWAGRNQAMNYWCPFSRADVGSRWCIALGLARDAKLNFNVSEQLNDWGLIQTRFSHWSEDIETGLSQTVQGAALSALTPWANLNTEPGIWYLHSFSRSHFTFSTVLQTSGQPFFKYVFCLVWLLKVLIPLLMLTVFLKHREYCQRAPSYLLFIPFESFHPNDWVHHSFHLGEISSGCECVHMVWMFFHLHVARVKLDATSIQTAPWLLILFIYQDDEV